MAVLGCVGGVRVRSVRRPGVAGSLGFGAMAGGGVQAYGLWAYLAIGLVCGVWVAFVSWYLTRRGRDRVKRAEVWGEMRSLPGGSDAARLWFLFAATLLLWPLLAVVYVRGLRRRK